MIIKYLLHIIALCQLCSLAQAMDTLHNHKKTNSPLTVLCKQIKDSTTHYNDTKKAYINTIMDHNFARNAYGLFIGQLTEQQLNRLSCEQLALLSTVATAPVQPIFSITSEQEFETLYQSMHVLGAHPRWFFNRYQFTPQAQQHPLYRTACVEIIINYAQQESASLVAEDFDCLTLEQINLLYKLSGYPDYCNRYILNEHEQSIYLALPEKFIVAGLFDANRLPPRQNLISWLRSLCLQ